MAMPPASKKEMEAQANAQAAKKMEQQYQELCQEKSKETIGHMCFPVDWYPEPMPIENSLGSCMIDRCRSFAQEGSAIFGLPASLDEGVEEAKGMSILVFPDSYGFAKGVLDMFPPNLIGKKQIVNKSIASMTEKDISRLLSDKWDLVLFFSGVDPPTDNTAAEIIKHQDGFTRPFLHILKAIVKNPECCKKLGVLTVDTMAEEREIHEECGMGITCGAVLFGMCNTARMEAESKIHCVETEWSLPAEDMKMLASEFMREETFGTDAVRILKTGRYVQRIMPSTPYEYANNKPFVLPDHGIIGISGGNGSLALVMGNWMMDLAKAQNKGGFTVKFLSRSMKIKDDDMPAWEEIEGKAQKLGITVEQARCDLGQPSDVERFVSEVSPNLTGFIHSAGIIKDGMLFNQTWELYEEVFTPKHRAAMYLHEALEKHANPDLSFLWMFSSMATYGNMGQSSYSGSNACLDALARHRRALGKIGFVVRWGAWGEVGMAKYLDAGSKHRINSGPQPYFLTREGLDGLEQGLRSGLPDVGCFKFNTHAAFMMFQGIASPGHQWMRRFHERTFPLPPAQKADYLDDVLRTATGGTYNLPMSSGLVWRKWVMNADDVDEEDNW